MLLDGESVKSCTVLAVQANGRTVTTAEGVVNADGTLGAVQQAFREEHGLQCGFCTPGMVMAVTSLLAENPRPTEQEVREGLEGNFCRCTGYHNIVRAVLTAAAKLQRTGARADHTLPRTRCQPTQGCPHDPRLVRLRGRHLRAHALALLAEHGEDAKLLAGGHSLLPMMKVRLAQPAVLIDIARVAELSGITGRRRRGRHRRDHQARRPRQLRGLAAEAPILAYAAAQVGDPQIRHRGTIGGSVAHADPSADLPMTLLALGATIEITAPEGIRAVGIDDFFTGPFESVLQPGRDPVRDPRAARQCSTALSGAAVGLPEVRPPGQRLGDRRGRRVRRPGRAGQHGRHPAARARYRGRAALRRLNRGGGATRGRGHLPRRGLPRRDGFPPAPGPRPDQARPGGPHGLGTEGQQAQICNGQWRLDRRAATTRLGWSLARRTRVCDRAGWAAAVGCQAATVCFGR